jgi:hypothetical protein
MRILFGSWPGYGHLLPMVPLIRAAQRGGHDVVVSSGSDMAGLIGQLGVTAHSSGLTLAESYARLPDYRTISELPPEQQAGFAARNLFGAGAVDRARDVRELMDTWRPDIVVHDTLELGSPTAAAMHGIPHVTHGYGPMVPDTAHFAAAIGSAVTDAGLPDPVPAVFAAPYVDICPPGLRGAEPNPWTTIYALRPSPGEIEPDAPIPWEFSDLPHADTVYLTLGTIMNQAAAVFRAVIEGCARWPVNLVVTTGPGFDPDVLGPLPPAVLTAPFLPQAAVLPHCRAGWQLPKTGGASDRSAEPAGTCRFRPTRTNRPPLRWQRVTDRLEARSGTGSASSPCVSSLRASRSIAASATQDGSTSSPRRLFS